MNIPIIVLVIYALICLAIGIYTALGETNNDYLIANRNLSSTAMMTSIVATYIGGTALVAFTAYVYQYGISMLAVFFGVAAGYLIFIYYGYQLRNKSKTEDYLTLSDVFYNGYDTKTGLLSALIIFLVFFGFLLNQFIAGSSILAAITGWKYSTALLLTAAIILTYLSLGGFKSVIKTDVFQYVILLLLLIVIGYTMTQGKLPEPITNPAPPNYPLIIAFLIYGILNAFSAADIWQRVYAARDDTVVRNGLIGAAILVILGGAALTIIGAAALANYPAIEPRQAVVQGLTELLPPVLTTGGIVFLFAAIMSSADSMLFVLATSLAKDYGNTSKLRRRTQIATLAIGVLAVILAYFFRDIVNIVLTIIGLQLALVPAVLAYFHANYSSTAAFTSLLAGTLYVAVLLAFGLFKPTLAIASFLIAGLALLVTEGTIRYAYHHT